MNFLRQLAGNPGGSEPDGARVREGGTMTPPIPTVLMFAATIALTLALLLHACP